MLVARTDDASDDSSNHGGSEGNPSCTLMMPDMMGNWRRRRVMVMGGHWRMVRGGCAVRRRSGMTRLYRRSVAFVVSLPRRGRLGHRHFLGCPTPVSAAWYCECCSAESEARESGDHNLDDVLVHITPTFLGFLPLHQVRKGRRQFLTKNHRRPETSS